MNNESLKAAVDDLNSLMMSGDLFVALDKYYAPNVTVLEKDHVVAESHEANVAREKEFIAGITDWREGTILSVAVGENVTMTEWHLDFVHEAYGHKKGNQVTVQHWVDGKIVREQFYSLY